MCGIAGFVGPGDRGDLFAMMAAVAHRGPDGSGAYVDQGRAVYLGHQRLSIVDLEGGAQPMWNTTRSLTVIFNGEIYNHLELRAELEGRGFRFTSDHSDTEVLLHGYEAWGDELPGRLNGMFAFCVYDVRQGRLFLARDRFGEKPLYFARQRGLFAFASELNAIAAHRRFDAQLDHESVHKLLGCGFIPAPRAILRDCEKLPGGSLLTYDLASGLHRTRRYWRYAVRPDRGWAQRSGDELAEDLRGRLFGAVRRRLAADVPVGCFLSGGVDSSAVVAAATRYRPKETLQTFSMGFDVPGFDEVATAQEVARSLGVSNTSDRLTFEQAQALAPTILAHLDQPTGDASILPTAALSGLARQYVKVALSGDGADELFAGYDPFRALQPAGLYRASVPPPVHNLISRLIDRLPASSRYMSMDFKLKRTLRGLSYPPDLWNPVWLAPAEPALMRELIATAPAPEQLYEEAIALWETSESGSTFDRALEFYANFYLQDGVLEKVDRASMMHSLEVRSVFLDNDIVDFSTHLPAEFKLRNGRGKYLLKRALRGIVPDPVLRRRKQGFAPPLTDWLRRLPEQPGQPLADLDPAVVRRLWREHQTGAADHRMLLWSLLSLQSYTPGRNNAAPRHLELSAATA